MLRTSSPAVEYKTFVIQIAQSNKLTIPLTSSSDSILTVNRQQEWWWDESAKSHFLHSFGWQKAPRRFDADHRCMPNRLCRSPSCVRPSARPHNSHCNRQFCTTRNERTRRVQKVCATTAASGRLGRTYAIRRRVCWRRPASRPCWWRCLAECFIIQRYACS